MPAAGDIVHRPGAGAWSCTTAAALRFRVRGASWLRGWTRMPAHQRPGHRVRSIERVRTSTVVGGVVRFTSTRTSVDVTIGQDNPAVRDFLSMLP